MLKTIAKYIQKFQLALGVACISIFFITILVQVICRYTGVTVIWTGEVSTYSFIWSVFMGAGVMTYENKHFAFTSFSDKLKGKSKEFLRVIIHIIMLLFSSAILYYGVVIAHKFWNYRWLSIPSMKAGYSWLCVPILGGACVIYCLSYIVDHINNMRSGKVK